MLGYLADQLSVWTLLSLPLSQSQHSSLAKTHGLACWESTTITPVTWCTTNEAFLGTEEPIQALVSDGAGSGSRLCDRMSHVA